MRRGTAHHWWACNLHKSTQCCEKPPLAVTYVFSSLYLGMHSAKIKRKKGDNRHLQKREKFKSIVEKQFTPLVPFVVLFFIRNTAALSAVNTLCIGLFLFSRQCSVAASGACLQSNRLPPLFLCFLSVLSDRRQGWGMSATSICTGVCCLLTLVSPGICESCHFSSQSQNLVCQNTEAEMILKIFHHNEFQFVNIISNLTEIMRGKKWCQKHVFH